MWGLEFRLGKWYFRYTIQAIGIRIKFVFGHAGPEYYCFLKVLADPGIIFKNIDASLSLVDWHWIIMFLSLLSRTGGIHDPNFHPCGVITTNIFYASRIAYLFEDCRSITVCGHWYTILATKKAFIAWFRSIYKYIMFLSIELQRINWNYIPDVLLLK